MSVIFVRFFSISPPLPNQSTATQSIHYYRFSQEAALLFQSINRKLLLH